MDAGRRQAVHEVACLKSRPGQQGPALGGADREAGDVKIAGSVKAGHLRRLSADQCAAGLRAPLGDALNDCRRDFLVKLAGCKIVQEKQRLSALNDNVVDAHGDQVDSDRVIDAALNRRFSTLCRRRRSRRPGSDRQSPPRLKIEQSAEIRQAPRWPLDGAWREPTAVFDQRSGCPISMSTPDSA